MSVSLLFLFAASLAQPAAEPHLRGALIVAGKQPDGNQNAMSVQRTPVALFIPGRITLGATSKLIVKVKGLETPGRSLFTSPCRIRYTVFTRDGKGVFMYPRAGTICPDVAYGFSTRRGVWEQFPLDLRWVKRANLPSGVYWITASVVASERMGSLVRLPAFASNTARLEIP